MKLTGLTAIAMKLSVFITILMGILLIPLLGLSERGEASPLMIPFFLFAVVVMVFKFALPSALKKHHFWFYWFWPFGRFWLAFAYFMIITEIFF